ncbi:MAG: RHS repeat-associated core domain-containing protein [Myxococcota bacterium]
MSPDGIIRTFAGTSEPGFSGENVPATQAQFGTVRDLAVGPHGGLYVADGNRVRRVDPSGLVHTIGGGEVNGLSGEDGPATEATFLPLSLAVDDVGRVYVGTSRRLHVIESDGTFTRLAGTDLGGDVPRDSVVPPGELQIDGPTDLALAPDGSLFFAEFGRRHVLMLAPGQTGHAVAGNGSSGDVELSENAQATSVPIDRPRAITLNREGQVVVAPTNCRCLRVITSVLPTRGAERDLTDEIAVGSDQNEVYVFDALGRHLRTVDPWTGEVQLTIERDGDERVTGLVDAFGQRTTIERGANGAPTAIVAPGGQRTVLTLVDGRVEAIEAPGGSVVGLGYDSVHGLIETVDWPDGSTTSFAFDEAQRLTREIDGRGAERTLSFGFVTEPVVGYEVTFTDGAGRPTTYLSRGEPGGGLYKQTTLASGQTTLLEVGPSGKRTVTYPDGTVAVAEYGPDPVLGAFSPVNTRLDVTLPSDRSMQRDIWRTATFDLQGRPQTVTETVRFNRFAATESTSTWTYDVMAGTLHETSATGVELLTTLDAHSRPTRIEPDGLDPIVFGYDGQGRITSVVQGVTSTAYTWDGRNHVTEIADAGGATMGYRWDAGGFLEGTTLPSNDRVDYVIDAMGRTSGVVTPLPRTHTFQWDEVGSLARFRPSWSATDYRWERDLGGALDRMITPAGDVVTWDTPDDDQELLGIASSEASHVFDYLGDTTLLDTATRTPVNYGVPHTDTYDWDGNQLRQIVSSGLVDATLDIDTRFLTGDLETSTLTIAGFAPVVRDIAIDGDRRITGFGPLGLDRGGPMGRVSTVTLGALTETRAFDSLGRVTERRFSIAGGEVYRETLGWDDRNRLARRAETGLASRIVDYVRTANGEVAEVRLDGATVEVYGYDVDGARTHRDVGGAIVDSSWVDGQLTQVGSQAYTFDGNGMLSARGSDGFVFSPRGDLLLARGTLEYSYDALSRRTGRSSSTEDRSYLYADPTNPLRVTDLVVDGVLTSLHYDDAGRLVAFDRSGIRFYVISDWVGTPRFVFDGTGALVKSVDRDIFGALIADSNPAFELPLGFAGGLEDPATGLVTFGFRDYDPVSGTFVAPDPSLVDGSWYALYRYANNDPVTFSDPYGLFSVGGSFYEGFGGGIDITVTGDGIGVCGNLGFGFGGGVSLDPFSGLPDPGLSLRTQITGGVGPVAISANWVGDDCGRGGGIRRRRTSFEGGFGPLTVSSDGFSLTANRENRRQGLGDAFLGVPDGPKDGRNYRIWGLRAEASATMQRCFVRRF